MDPFEIALIGLTLLCFTVVSRRSERWPLTMPMVFVVVGAAMSATGVVEVESELAAVGLLAEVTLAVILFSDATRISLPRLRRFAALPARLLGIGLPLTVGLGTLVNWLLFPGWPIGAAILLAAILAPTDAALGSAVIEDESVPARDRLALNVESGLNDGLVVPVVTVATSIVLDTGRSAGSWIQFVAEQLGYGTAVGAAVGFGGIGALRWARHHGWSDGRYEQISTFALPIIALCAAIAIDGNGFIAAFVAGLSFGSGWFAGESTSEACVEEAEHLSEFTEDGAQLLGVVAFFVFGNLFVGEALGQFGWAVIATALASLTVVRMVPVMLALTGTGLKLPTKLFLGWFGPRGLASIVFGILLFEELEGTAEYVDLMLGTISLTVLLSVLLHGASASFGAAHYGKWTADDHADHHDREMDDLMPRSRWSRRS